MAFWCWEEATVTDDLHGADHPSLVMGDFQCTVALHLFNVIIDYYYFILGGKQLYEYMIMSHNAGSCSDFLCRPLEDGSPFGSG